MISLRSLPLLFAVVCLVACGEDDPDDKASHAVGGGSSGGSDSSGGVIIPGDNGGTTAGGTMSSGGATSGGTTSSGGSADGGTSTNGGTAGMSSGGAGLYLPCESQADCEQFGGGKICCAVGEMHFCTKQSACSGDALP